MAFTGSASYLIVGDVHGHLQLALCAAARWQRQRERKFAGLFLCGDVGTFTEDSQLDSATRKHAKDNPCEPEFMTQWAMTPPAPWLDAIFRPEPDGLGLDCPVVMVHGNHEGFAHLETLYPRRMRTMEPKPVADLPAVDTGGHILYLPSGWTAVTQDGLTIGGIGGMEAGQRRARYHELAYIDEDAVQDLLIHGPLDLLLTHQGPAKVQGDHGSPTLDLLLDEPIAPWWFHGHSTPIDSVTTIGKTSVVPLGDLAFSHGTPGLKGWAILDYEAGKPTLQTDPPDFWRELRRHHWHLTPGGRLVYPELVRFMNLEEAARTEGST